MYIVFLYSVWLLHFIWILFGVLPCACLYVQVCVNNHNKCSPTRDGVGWCSGDRPFSGNAGWNSVNLTWCPCFPSPHTNTRHIRTKIIHHYLLIIHLLSSSCLTWYVRSMANAVIKRAKSQVLSNLSATGNLSRPTTCNVDYIFIIKIISDYVKY